MTYIEMNSNELTREGERESECTEQTHAATCEGPSDCEALRTSVGLLTKTAKLSPHC